VTAVPLGGSCVTVRSLEPVQLSLATISPTRSGMCPVQVASAGMLRFGGQVGMAGGVVSASVLLVSHGAVLPAAFLTVRVTVVVLPSAAVVPAIGCCVTVSPPAVVQLSEAMTSPVRSGM